MKEYKVFVLDYDGTIVDTMEMWKNIYAKYLNSIGVKTYRDVDKEINKLSEYEIKKFLKDEYNINMSYKKLEKGVNKYLKNNYESYKLKDGAKEFLDYLKSQGKRIILHSQTAKPLLIKSLKANGIFEYFDEIYSVGDLRLSKTNFSSFEYILKKEKLEVKDVVTFEDSFRAYKCDKENGMDAYLIKDYSNMNKQEEINEYTKDYYTLKELIEVLKNDN